MADTSKEARIAQLEADVRTLQQDVTTLVNLLIVHATFITGPDWVALWHIATRRTNTETTNG